MLLSCDRILSMAQTAFPHASMLPVSHKCCYFINVCALSLLLADACALLMSQCCYLTHIFLQWQNDVV